MCIFTIIHYINNNKYKFNTQPIGPILTPDLSGIYEHPVHRAYMPLLTYYKLIKKEINNTALNKYMY